MKITVTLMSAPEHYIRLGESEGPNQDLFDCYDALLYEMLSEEYKAYEIIIDRSKDIDDFGIVVEPCNKDLCKEIDNLIHRCSDSLQLTAWAHVQENWSNAS